MSGVDTLDELHHLAAAASRERGDELFLSLAHSVSKALNGSKSLISQIVGANRVRTLAVIAHGTPAPNYEYDLDGTPCAAVLEGETVHHHESGLAERFPLTSQNYQGYFGVPLSAADGSILGHLCVYTADALQVSERQRLLCEIVAARASCELQRVYAERRLQEVEARNRYLQQEIKSAHNFDEIVGASPGLVKVLENVSRVGPTDAIVLIFGETGTGKELIARAIHSASRRADLPFIKLDCAGLPANRIESELFGHENGAFADAQRRPAGCLELANGGTLFLDEIGELKPDTQAKLLRVLQENVFERVGSSDAIKANVRIVATTNRDLRKAVRDGEFREDLYYRLNVFPLDLPPLRARADDIPLLVQYFARKYAPRVGHRVDGVDPDTLVALTRYPWPGNIRELENLVERALVLNTSAMLKIPPEMLTLHTSDERADVAAAATGMHRILPPPSAEFDDTENTGLHHVQREHILRVLNATHWVIEGNHGAALKLGMKPATLRHRMKKLGITRARSANLEHASPGA
jgi:formate hydrogenlyase transcriptional activator